VISSSKTAGAGDTGVAGDIRITVGNVTVNPDDLTITCATTPLGDILVENGAQILANGTGEAGAIKMFAGKNATINGLVSSEGTTGSGRGGPITIDACCDLVIGDTGKVISKGTDPGADLVHLQACVIQIFGLVASTGPGHGSPFDNLCNVDRPGKPANSSACVEIWAGTTLLIDSTNGHKGEVNADIGQAGGTQGSSWIDALANGAIIIRGNATVPTVAAGNNDTNPAFAVHANQRLRNGHGGDITVISRDSTVTTFGRALQANASTGSNGGKGGHIVVLARDNVAFGAVVAAVDVPAFIQAAGDITGGGSQQGGTIVAQSFTGTVTGVAGSQLSVEGPGGTATLTGCADPAGTYLGTVIPAAAEIDTTICPGVSPPLPSPADLKIPSAECASRCQGLAAGIKTGVKFHDLNQNGVQDANEPGLPGWEIHVFDTVTKALVQSTVTLAADPNSIPPTPAGFYSFTLDPGNYTVCEGLQAGWTQTAPLAGSVPPPGESLANCTTYTNSGAITPGPRGYNFTIVGAEVLSGNDFGNVMPVGACLKLPNLLPTHTFTLNSDPTQIQKIIDAAAIDDVILLLPLNGVKTENISINKRIQLFGCSITLKAATAGAPVVTTTPGADGGLTKDIHATGSTVAGYKIAGSNHTIVNVRAFSNAIGFWITGNSNVVTGALGTLKNGTGIRIDGNSNLLDTNNGVEKSSGDGVVISAGATGNTVKKYIVRGSAGDGFKVEAGASLTVLSENKAYSNGLNGYLILGSDTTMSRNIAGDTGTGNAADGIRVDGSNGPMSENVSKANSRAGIRVTGTGHKLAKNRSGGTGNQENGSCQYVVGVSNVNGGSNTSSNYAPFTFTDTGANSPAACVPAPPTP
jgi:SdrD B-like domain/Right handed beta helix region